MTQGAESSRQVTRLVGVYDADGTLRGELAYFVGARLGRAHCALCEVTHGWVRPRTEWKTARARLPVPFDTYHRDDQPGPVRAAVDGTAPVVVAETPAGIVALLGPEEIEACLGSPERLVAALDRAIGDAGLVWPRREGGASRAGRKP